MVKVTFSLDDATVAQIRQLAARLGRPQSQIVREAVSDYAERSDMLSERERRRAIGVLERLRQMPPSGSLASVTKELRSLRASRRGGGRRHPST